MDKHIIDAVRLFNCGSTLNKNCRNKVNYNSEPKINYDENVSIRQIFTTFIERYINFKKEYEQIGPIEGFEKLEFVEVCQLENGEEVAFSFFDNNTMSGDYNDGSCFLCFSHENDTYEAYSFNICRNSKVKILNFDKEKIKQYIDLFERNEDLFGAYYHFYNGMIFGNGYNVLWTNINGDILKNINSMEITCGNSEIVFSLETPMSNDLEVINKNIVIEELNVISNCQLEDYFLDNVYLNKDYLPTIYKSHQKTKILKFPK